MLKYKLAKKCLAVITIQLTLKRGITNMRRNPAFAAVFTYLYTEILQALLMKPECLEVKQADNNILVIWDCAEGNEKLIQQYLVLQKIKYRAQKRYADSALLLKIVADLIHTDIVIYENVKNKASQILLQSDVIGHTHKILISVSGSKYSSLLVTHAFRQMLPQPLQKILSCPYYFYHLCCYGKNRRVYDKSCDSLSLATKNKLNSKIRT